MQTLCDVLFVGLKAFNVLAALATEGLGVSSTICEVGM